MSEIPAPLEKDPSIIYLNHIEMFGLSHENHF